MAIKIVKKKKGTAGFQRLRALGEDKLSQIHAMFVEDQSAVAVAEHIQKVWGEFKDVKTGTLAKQLTRYRKEVLASKLHVNKNGKVEDDGTEEGKVQLLKLKGDIDVYENLVEMIKIQIERVNKLRNQEGKMPLPMREVRAELQFMAQLNAQLRQTEFELGIRKQAPKTIKGDFTVMPLAGSAEAERLRVEVENQKQAQLVTHKVFEMFEEADTNGITYEHEPTIDE